jgi:hypothetical protein
MTDMAASDRSWPRGTALARELGRDHRIFKDAMRGCQENRVQTKARLEAISCQLSGSDGSGAENARASLIARGWAQPSDERQAVLDDLSTTNPRAPRSADEIVAVHRQTL